MRMGLAGELLLSLVERGSREGPNGLYPELLSAGATALQLLTAAG
jgi:hypothetical protein